VAKDSVEAVKWFRKAADQGNADAQCRLGVMYSNGEGVAKMPSRAQHGPILPPHQGKKFL
jgi:TPR repeat protein